MERTRASSTSSADSETVCIEIQIKPRHVGKDFTELEVKKTYSLCPIKYKNKLNMDSTSLRKIIKEKPNALRIRYGGDTLFIHRGKMQYIGKQFRCMQALQKLETLNSYSSWITDGAMKHFGESLKYIRSLKTLNLCFETNGGILTDWDLNSLSHGLKSLKTLQSISLNITFGFQISNKGLEYLSDGWKNLNSLKSIKLRFCNCPQIDDEGLKCISEGLKHISLMENFNFDFSYCNRISDQGLQNLSEGMKHLTSVQNIGLNFTYCTQLTNQGLRNLSEGLRHLNSLHNIGLCFDRCNKITNRGLRSLNEQLKYMASLQHIKLRRKRRTRQERQGLIMILILILIIILFFFLIFCVPLIVYGPDAYSTTYSSK